MGKRRKSMIPHGKVESGSTNFKHTLPVAAMDSKGRIVFLWFRRCRIYKRSQFVQRFWSIELPSNHMSQAQAVVPAKAQHGEVCASFVVRKLVFPSCWIVLFPCELWQSNRTLLEETWTPPTIDTAWTHWHALMSLIGQAQAGSLGRILMGWILPMKPTHHGRVFDVAKHAPAHINASTLFDMHTWQYMHTAYK